MCTKNKNSVWVTRIVKSTHSTMRQWALSLSEKRPINASTVIRNVPPHFRRCGRGILKGAAFRQRPLSRLLINFLAGTRKLPPEGPAPKHSFSAGIYTQFLIWDDDGLHIFGERPHPALRATFPSQGKAWGTDCDRRESPEGATPVLRHWFAMTTYLSGFGTR